MNERLNCKRGHKNEKQHMRTRKNIYKFLTLHFRL